MQQQLPPRGDIAMKLSLHPYPATASAQWWPCLAAVALLVPSSVNGADGQKIYADTCVPCHGEDGRGRTPQGRKIGAKDLGQSKLGEAEIRRQINEGTKDAKGVQKMPPFKDKLSQDQIEALVAYVKTFRR